MDIIKSKENRAFKELVKLSVKKYRDDENVFKIEGVNLVKEAICHDVALLKIIVDAENESEEIESIISVLHTKKANCEVLYFSNKLFVKISDTVNPQGICAIAKKRCYSKAEFFHNTDGMNFVVLESVQDPGNVGTIIRTAEAAGYAGAIIVGESADVYSPKVVRACAGTLFRLPILKMEKMNETLQMLKANNKKTVCLDMGGEADYFEADLKSNIALVLGNEGNGIRKETLDAADSVLKIPMAGRIESLNVAVAAAIVMYENMRV